MSYTIRVKVINVGDVMTFKSGFKIREVVGTDDIEMEEKYPQKIPFVMKGGNVDSSGSLNKGDILNITFTIGGRAWQDKLGNTRYSPSINCTRYEREGVNADAIEEKAESPKQPSPEELDNLPF